MLQDLFQQDRYDSNRRYPSGSDFLWDSGFKIIQAGTHFFWVFFSPNGNKNGNKSHQSKKKGLNRVG